MTNQQDPGYELHTAVLLSDRDGSPVAPVHQTLRTADGLLRSSPGRVRRKSVDKLDRLLPVFRSLGKQGWSRPPVFLIDREADSVTHYRLWDRQGHWLVVRADDSRKARHQGQERLLPEVHQHLRDAGASRRSRDVTCHGQPARQYAAEAAICLTRPGKHKHGRLSAPGRALALRLAVAEVRDGQGQVLAHRLLLTNVPALFDAGRVALWYYWRWRIESYFKLPKSAGQEVEHWQQESGAAIAKRLLVAAVACALAWKLARGAHPLAATLRGWLVRLSGRQMKHGVGYTEPALLAGRWTLLQTLEITRRYDVDHLREILQQVLVESEPHSEPPKPPRRRVV